MLTYAGAAVWGGGAEEATARERFAALQMLEERAGISATSTKKQVLLGGGGGGKECGPHETAAGRGTIINVFDAGNCCQVRRRSGLACAHVC
jgi:hypothetical protein